MGLDRRSLHQYYLQEGRAEVVEHFHLREWHAGTSLPAMEQLLAAVAVVVGSAVVATPMATG